MVPSYLETGANRLQPRGLGARIGRYRVKGKQLKLAEVRDFLVEVAEGTPVTAHERNGRPVLAAINLRITEGKLEGVSTDSYILIHRSIPVEEPDDMDWTLFNAERIKKALRWFPKSEKAEIDFTTKAITISSDFISVSIPMIEGTFPDFQRLRPTDEPTAQTTLAINGTFAARISKAFKGEGLIMEFHGDNKPILVKPVSPLLGRSTLELQEDQWAILMPIRMPR